MIQMTACRIFYAKPLSILSHIQLDAWEQIFNSSETSIKT